MRIQWSSARPLDLWAVVAVAGAAAVAVASGAPGWIRVPLGLAAVLVAPGYAFVAALFPERHGPISPHPPRDGTAPTDEPPPRPPVGQDAPEPAQTGRRGLEPLERAALSLGLSIAIVPLLGLGLNFTPFGIREAPVVAALVLFTTISAAAAWHRRGRLPPDERFQLHVNVEAPSWGTQSALDKGLTIGLVAAIVVAAGTLAYVVMAPRPGEAFTEFYQLGPTGLASCYPSTYRDGEYRSASLGSDCPGRAGNVTLGIVNHEGREVTYWLRVVWTRERLGEGNVTLVEDRRVVEETPVTLPHVEPSSGTEGFRPQHERLYPLPPPPWNGTLRLSFELHLEPPPPVTEGVTDEPYRRLHLLIDVPEEPR